MRVFCNELGGKNTLSLTTSHFIKTGFMEVPFYRNTKRKEFRRRRLFKVTGMLMIYGGTGGKGSGCGQGFAMPLTRLFGGI